jgi:hypothetical protein
LYPLLKKLFRLLAHVVIRPSHASPCGSTVGVILLPGLLISGLVFAADDKAVFLDSRGMAWECLAQKPIDHAELIGPCEPHTGELRGKGATQLDAGSEPSVEVSDPGSGEVTNQAAEGNAGQGDKNLWGYWSAFDEHGYITNFLLALLVGFLAAFLPGLAATRSTAAH